MPGSPAFPCLWVVRRHATSLSCLQITGASTLGSDEVDKMVNEAEKYAEEDKKKREAVDTKNQVGTRVQVPCSTLAVRSALWLQASRHLPELARESQRNSTHSGAVSTVISLD